MRLGIVGYGNLGKACEKIALDDGKINEVCIFSRRDNIKSPYSTAILSQEYIFKKNCDVYVLCVGSMSDLTPLALSLAGKVNTVDSFDNHAQMEKYAKQMKQRAGKGDTLHFIGIGWDPGLFSLMRGLFSGILQGVKPQTFWGRGVSQGHSEAIRRIVGVLDAKQYTIPISNAVKSVREGSGDNLKDSEKHKRECYVVPCEGANLEKIEEKILTMPDYFAPYDTKVHFVDKEWFDENLSGMEHAGVVLANGKTGEYSSNMEFVLKLENNPIFTASVLIAYAKANYAMSKKGICGVKSILDIPISEILIGDWIDKVRLFI